MKCNKNEARLILTILHCNQCERSLTITVFLTLVLMEIYANYGHQMAFAIRNLHRW